MELSKRTLRHFLDLRHHRSTLLEGVSSIAVRHINHLNELIFGVLRVTAVAPEGAGAFRR